ncbi:MAG: hypothetical protein R3B99_16480 [Polyangiales bacterium]
MGRRAAKRGPTASRDPADAAAAAWREATEATEAARDPLAQYLLDVSHRGRPSPAWSARWGEGDAGLRAAWAASHDKQRRDAVLQATGRSEARHERKRRCAPSCRHLGKNLVRLPDWSAIRRYEAALVEAARRAVPALFG